MVVAFRGYLSTLGGYFGPSRPPGARPPSSVLEQVFSRTRTHALANRVEARSQLQSFHDCDLLSSDYLIDFPVIRIDSRNGIVVRVLSGGTVSSH